MPKKIDLSEEQITIVRELASKGETKVDIAKALRRNRSVVDRVLKEYNIELVPTSKNKKGRKFDWTSELEEKLKEMYDSNEYSLVDIANELDTSLKTITNKGNELSLKKAESKPLTDGDIEYFTANYGIKSIEEMAKERRLKEYGVHKKLRLMGMFVAPATYESRQMPKCKEFWEDYINPKMSHSEVSYKWGLHRSTVGKWRKKDFGSNFKTKINTFLHMSIPEQRFEKILNELNMTYDFQRNIEGYRIDFYLGFNIIVEINGRYYHELDRTIVKDEKKNNDLSKKGYNIITIWDDELDNTNAIKTKILTQYEKALKAQMNAVLG